jgi:WhiB family redox-sensing transcriptional regulator
MTSTDKVPPTHIELLVAIERNGGVPCETLPDVFYPEPYSGIPVAKAVELAKSLCAGCPISDLCLRVAVAQRMTEGIWGGLTADERRGLRRG